MIAYLIGSFILGVVAIVFLLLYLTPIGPFIWAVTGLGLMIWGILEIQEALQPARTMAAAGAGPRAPSPGSVQPVAATRPFQFNLPEEIPTDLKCPSCGASIGPTTRRCDYCGSILQPAIDLPDPVHLSDLRVGQSLRILVPAGDRVYRVQGRALLGELWQATRGANIPWTFTGNLYAGFALQGTPNNAYLLNWQDRFYLFDRFQMVNDQHIQRYFLPYARAFGQSDQMGRVEFEYQGQRWRVVDIGRMQVIFTEGEGLHLQRGAEARFLYAQSGLTHLLLEDYRAGGAAQDMLWFGYQIQKQDIRYGSVR